MPYLAVGRTDGKAAVYVYRAGWHGVDGDLRRGFRSSASVRGKPDFAPTQVKCLLCPWVPVSGGSRSGTASVSWAGRNVWNLARVQRSWIWLWRGSDWQSGGGELDLGLQPAAGARGGEAVKSAVAALDKAGLPYGSVDLMAATLAD